MLLVLRRLYGIGVGGEWGLGASLAMEKIPAGKRGFWSSVLQHGYPVGYMFAAIAFFVVEPIGGWREVLVRPHVLKRLVDLVLLMGAFNLPADPDRAGRFSREGRARAGPLLALCTGGLMCRASAVDDQGRTPNWDARPAGPLA